ncbi:fatty acid desaturase [Photobacterium sp. WH77]|uniref:fatty acid desaturase n=1 Tax=Photobacterium TaxID=657 RepID=UPI001EDA5845|nr:MULTISPECIES: fatty acid desaturase [Photobacterium]MCG2837435.1 fatty acid desaturase [Photobacterium sp. WH77]MCG2844995.1 fatty acid desaturase [Photobacterium sp. WH80]
MNIINSTFDQSVSKKISLRNELPSDVKRQILDLYKPNGIRSAFLYLLIFSLIVTYIYVAVHADSVWITLFAIILIASQQHALYILNHDASHFSLFKDKSKNIYTATILSNYVMFHHPEAWSFTQWRRIHMLHHKHLFTQDDPNYVGREMRGDTASSPSLVKIILKTLEGVKDCFLDLFFNKVSYINSKGKIYKNHRKHFGHLFYSFEDDQEMENERKLSLMFYILSFSIITYLSLWEVFLVYWILPMYTIYPLILRFHDITEHYWEEKSTQVEINTRSRKDGLLTKLLISPLPRGYHCEHHIFPSIPVTKLPLVNRYMKEHTSLHTEEQGIWGLMKEINTRKKNDITM